MAWNDNAMIKTFLQFRDEFKIETFVETGTYRGINAELYSHHFKNVLTVEINDDFFKLSKERLKDLKNVDLFHMPSWEFLVKFREDYDNAKRSDIILFYFDAHFYDPNLSHEDKWVIVKELKALEDFRNAVICIHDFDCENLGHINYAGEHLNWQLIGDYLNRVNGNFIYYTNTKDLCDINDEKSIRNLPITVNEYVLDAIKFINSSDLKKYRGVLYALPHTIDLNIMNLKRFIP